MTRVPVFTGLVRDGHLELDSPRRFAAHVSGFEGQHVEVVVRKPKSQRGLSANAYYWGVVVQAVSEYTGYEPEEAHDALKLLFLTDHDTGTPLPRVKSTAKLSTAEFSDYVERVKRWAATELSIYIPDANEPPEDLS